MQLTTLTAPRPAWQHAYAADLKRDVDTLRNSATLMRLTSCVTDAPLLLQCISNLSRELLLARAGNTITSQAHAALADKLEMIRNSVDMIVTTEGDRPEHPVQWTEPTLKRVENSGAVRIPRVGTSPTGSRSASTDSSSVFSNAFGSLRSSRHTSAAEGTIPAPPAGWPDSSTPDACDTASRTSPHTRSSTSDEAGALRWQPATARAASRFVFDTDSDIATETASLVSAGSSCNWSDGTRDAVSIVSAGSPRNWQDGERTAPAGAPSMAVAPSVANAPGSAAGSIAGDAAGRPASSLDDVVLPGGRPASSGTTTPTAKSRWIDLPRRMLAKLKAWLQRALRRGTVTGKGESKPVQLTSRHLPSLTTIGEPRQATFADFWQGRLDAEGLALSVQVSAENQLIAQGVMFTAAESLALQLELLESARDQAPTTATPRQAWLLDSQIAAMRRETITRERFSDAYHDGAFSTYAELRGALVLLLSLERPDLDPASDRDAAEHFADQGLAVFTSLLARATEDAAKAQVGSICQQWIHEIDTYAVYDTDSGDATSINGTETLATGDGARSHERLI